ncbi:hypothetical protein CEXT_544761 [Caerostris extrusa]|uniref:Uncharacterized protein n=1 Tax=Caerostris extrusa TaxID=172846 RepID=A0AAV4TSR8_CAEEX|nr:hypothetical protein CEXT_544761 [Caerostris extrusa]
MVLKDYATKYEPKVLEVELLEANPDSTHVRLPDGQTGDKHLAPVAESSSTEIEEESNLQDQEEALQEPQYLLPRTDD